LGRNIGIKIEGRRVDIGVMPLRALVRRAYRLEDYQLTGPDWMIMESFDIVAHIPDGATQEQLPELLQALLAERFGLVVRRESKEQSIYALTVGKGGPKLKEADLTSPPSETPFPDGAGGRALMGLIHGPDGLETFSMLKGTAIFEAERIAMPELARVLMKFVNFPVIDKTALKGLYQVAIGVPGQTFSGGYNSGGAGMLAMRGGLSGAGGDQAPDPSGVSIFASLEKLGLRLERGKAPIEHLTVEHLEKTPTEN
jgi:uncharacterized protein (TIGR03435 family)